MPTLYVVATPIGNLEDISLRALRILKEVKLIAAKDTRRTRRLLATYDIKTPMTSYYEHNKQSKLDYLLTCLEEGDIALVSEAGMPGMSDPGYELITAASQRGITVVPVPGPSAIITALVISGLPTDRFLYIGFLPRKASARQRQLEASLADPGLYSEENKDQLKVLLLEKADVDSQCECMELEWLEVFEQLEAAQGSLQQ